MKKSKIILIVIGALIVLGSISVAVLAVYKPDYIKSLFNKPYTAVYLSSGEMYIGKLSTFPDMTLTDAYLLQVVADTSNPSGKSLQLAPLKDAIWSPTELHFNRDQVIFTAPVRDDSQVVQKIKGN